MVTAFLGVAAALGLGRNRMGVRRRRRGDLSTVGVWKWRVRRRVGRGDLVGGARGG